MSEQLSPEQVVQILNLYLGVMTDVINQYKGTILHSTQPLQNLANLKLRLLHESKLATVDIYAKVIQPCEDNLFVLRFTNVPPQAIALLNSLHQMGKRSLFYHKT
ncbi:MAG TPA: hypothetical protein V6D25_08095 [Leptolyngbyaceae cyanobacterium]